MQDKAKQEQLYDAFKLIINKYLSKFEESEIITQIIGNHCSECGSLINNFENHTFYQLLAELETQIKNYRCNQNMATEKSLIRLIMIIKTRLFGILDI